MPLTKADIIEILEAAESLGLDTVEIEGLKAKFQPKEWFPNKVTPVPVPEMKAEDIIKPLSVLDDVTEEEVQYWATPYYDELQEKKQREVEAKKEKSDEK